MLQTADALRALGADVDVDVTFEQEPHTSGYDVVHAFNIWHPHTALAQLRHLRAGGVPSAAPRAPFDLAPVFTPARLVELRASAEACWN